MARKPSIRYYDSRGGYYTCHRGRQVRLATGPDDAPTGSTYLTALDAFKALLAFDGADQAGAANPVRVVVDLYLDHVEQNAAPRTYLAQRAILAHFADKFGEQPVSRLTPTAYYLWIRDMGEPRKHATQDREVAWGPGGQRHATAVVSACLNWAAETRLIPSNPLGKLRRPSARSRGAEALLGSTPQERSANHRRVLEAAPKSLRPLIVVMEATGCRPGELALATAAHFDPRRRALVFRAAQRSRRGEQSHKTASKDKDRLILLTGEALETVRRLAEHHPTGPMFRRRAYTKAGERREKGWTGQAIADAFERIREKTGIPALTAYSYRHTFATAWLEDGRSIDLLAELLGNTPAVIRDHYSHLLSDHDNLRAHLSDFRPTGGGERADTPSPRLFDDEASRAG